ncbi:MAG: hypothetical protein LBF51_11300 [Zoogloeaceae bacterium]|nr:hypothetical protein [Zoogloeaceae bacterium]
MNKEAEKREIRKQINEFARFAYAVAKHDSIWHVASVDSAWSKLSYKQKELFAELAHDAEIIGMTYIGMSAGQRTKVSIAARRVVKFIEDLIVENMILEFGLGIDTSENGD